MDKIYKIYTDMHHTIMADKHLITLNYSPVYLRNRLKSAGLEPVLIHTENHV